MYCPACGNTIPDQSKFCRYCGTRINAPVPPTVGQAHPGQWEYKEVFIPNGAFSQTFTLKMQYRNFPLANDLIGLWQSYKPQLPAHIKQELDQGWEPDPNFMGETCLEYNVRRAEVLKDFRIGEWLFYILATIGTFGIALPLVPLLYWASVRVVEPTGVRIRLRRLN